MVRKSYLDEKDAKILKLLQENARISYTKIAELTNLSEAAVRKRIRKMEEQGIIKKYTIEINYKALGYKVAWVGIDVKPEKMIYVLENLNKINDIVKNIYTSVGDHDIMVEVVYKDTEELNSLIKKLEGLDGVIKVCPAMLVERIK